MKSQRDAFFDALYERAITDKRIIVLTADCGAPALDRWQENIPDQFINVGIAEQNMVAVAIGLALSGKRPYCYAIIPFLTGRAYDQIRVACMMNLPIVFVGIGAGYSYDDSGPTHHGIDDIGLMRMLPHMRILQAIDERTAAYLATLYPCPTYIRLDRDNNKEYVPHFKVGEVSWYPVWLWPSSYPENITEVTEEHFGGGLGGIVAEQYAPFKRRYIKNYCFAYGRDTLRKLNEL